MNQGIKNLNHGCEKNMMFKNTKNKKIDREETDFK